MNNRILKWALISLGAVLTLGVSVGVTAIVKHNRNKKVNAPADVKEAEPEARNEEPAN